MVERPIPRRCDLDPAFFDVRGAATMDKFPAEEGAAALGLLRRLAAAGAPPTSTWWRLVVVAENLRRLISDDAGLAAWLGGDPTKARTWAPCAWGRRKPAI